MRALLVTDSISLPRPSIGLTYEDTYVAKLEAYCQCLHLMQGGGFTIAEYNRWFNNWASYVPANHFDLGIIQLGIVDCAPRPVTPTIREKISNLPWPVKNIATGAVHGLRPHIQKHLGFTQYTPIDEFTQEYYKLLTIAARLCPLVCAILVLPVLPEVEMQSPGISEQIGVYNHEIRKMCSSLPHAEVIDLAPHFCLKPTLFLTKNAHITKEGHAVIWGELKARIDNWR